VLAHHNAALAASLTVLFASGTSAHAVEPKAGQCKWGARREIDGHSFLFPVFVPSAVVASYLGLHTGLELDTVPDVAAGNLGQFDMEQIRITEGIDAGVRLFDGVGLFLSVGGHASASIDVPSLVVRGSDYLIGVSGGVIVKLLRIDDTGTQFSLRARVARESGQTFALLPLIDAVAAGEARTAAQLLSNHFGELMLTPVTTFGWGGELAIAQPIGAAFAVQAALGMSFETAQFDPFDVASDARRRIDLATTRPELGVALTADADPAGVPFALMLEYQIALPRTDNGTSGREYDRSEQVLGASLYYSGRADLQTGLLGYVQFGAQPIEGRDATGNARVSGDPRRVGGQLMLRYFW
jgi:hypothetical protein